MPRGAVLRGLLVGAVAVSLAAAGCTSTADQHPAPEQTPPDAAVFSHPGPDGAPTVLPAGDAAEAALSSSLALYSRAPVVVAAPEADLDAQARAASAAVALGAPLLVTSPADQDAVESELERLEAVGVLDFGRTGMEGLGGEGLTVVPAPTEHKRLGQLLGRGLPPAAEPLTEETAAAAVARLDRQEPVLLTAEAIPDADGSSSGSDVAEVPDLPVTRAAAPLDDVLLLTTGSVTDLAAVATARAAGAAVHVVADGDPRASAETIEAVSGDGDRRVLALGDGFGDDALLGGRLAVARTGVQLPGGGQTVFPGRRMVALYGHPGTASLGVLGEQPVDEAVLLAQRTARQYQPLSDRPVVPAFEIIATVASSAAGPDGDYSTEATVDQLRPWVDAAGAAGVYVILDLQPGTTDFLTQAKIYAELLAEPHVGLALDPEWRLKPGQRHLRQIGSVDVDEVNAVADWLAGLTRQRQLPQKVLMLHQFRTSMIRDRQRLHVGHDELALVVHADGNGAPGQKVATWDAIRAGAPAGVWWGWKNFYDEDSPTLTPQQTYQVEPVPDLVSYQ